MSNKPLDDDTQILEGFQIFSSCDNCRIIICVHLSKISCRILRRAFLRYIGEPLKSLFIKLKKCQVRILRSDLLLSD